MGSDNNAGASRFRCTMDLVERKPESIEPHPPLLQHPKHWGRQCCSLCFAPGSGSKALWSTLRSLTSSVSVLRDCPSVHATSGRLIFLNGDSDCGVTPVI